MLVSTVQAHGMVRTRPSLSSWRISPADKKNAVDVIASKLRYLHDLRQVALRATLAALIETPLQETRGSASRKSGRVIVSHDPTFSREAASPQAMRNACI
jgi:hypothetical protein